MIFRTLVWKSINISVEEIESSFEKFRHSTYSVHSTRFRTLVLKNQVWDLKRCTSLDICETLRSVTLKKYSNFQKVIKMRSENCSHNVVMRLYTPDGALRRLLFFETNFYFTLGFFLPDRTNTVSNDRLKLTVIYFFNRY